jgi:hypothetical protein
MINRHALGAISFCLITLFMALPVSAKNSTLDGLPGVWVKVEITPSLVKGGLVSHQVRSDIESQLQEAGVRLLTQKESRSTAGQPKLLLQIKGTKVQENWKFYTFAINLYLIQNVRLTRTDDSGSVQASTWFNNIAAHGYIGDIQTRIKGLLNSFVDDYKSANP